jgi:hypothetical protein
MNDLLFKLNLVSETANQPGLSEKPGTKVLWKKHAPECSKTVRERASKRIHTCISMKSFRWVNERFLVSCSVLRFHVNHGLYPSKQTKTKKDDKKRKFAQVQVRKINFESKSP